MIGTVVKKEIAANLLSYKFFIVILLLTLLLATSFFVLYKDFKGRQADYELVRPKPGEPTAVLPPNPLSIFAKGLDEAMTRSFEVSRIGIDVRAGQQSGNAIFSFFPAPDFVYIVKVVLSLIALLFGFDLVSREKETGVLRLMLSNSVSRATILAGKWLGNFLSLAVPFLLVTLIGFAVINLDSGIRFGAAGTGRFFLLVFVSLLYAALFLSLGILVSSLTRKAAGSLVVLLLVWTVAVFVLPNLGTLLARQMVEVPSVKALSEKRSQIWTREVLLLIVEGREAGGGAAGSRSEGDQAEKHFDTINADLDRLEEDYRKKFDRLVRLSKAVNRISPAASFVYAVTELVGTGIGEESRLKAEVIRFKDAVLADLKRSGKSEAAFAYAYRPVGLVLARGTLFDLAELAVLAVLFFGLSFAAFVRYDVR
jgi:ABC-type transport system involved in multi-copper enzyme maturation permease subunit